MTRLAWALTKTRSHATDRFVTMGDFRAAAAPWQALQAGGRRFNSGCVDKTSR